MLLISANVALKSTTWNKLQILYITNTQISMHSVTAWLTN
jgi:hypothetical protein